MNMQRDDIHLKRGVLSLARPNQLGVEMRIISILGYGSFCPPEYMG
jgi:hypothetical protein